MSIRYIRLLELAISVHVLMAIIKKQLKIDVSFYTILQILSLIGGTQESEGA